MPCRLLNNIEGGNCVAERPETTLNIVVNRVTFLLSRVLAISNHSEFS